MSAEALFSYMANEIDTFHKNNLKKEIFSIIFEGDFNLDIFKSQLKTKNICYLDCKIFNKKAIESIVAEVIDKTNQENLCYLIVNNIELCEIEDRYVFYQILLYNLWKTIQIEDHHYIIDPKSLLVFIVITKDFNTFNFAYRSKFDRFFKI